MTTTLYTHPVCRSHAVPPGHPERPGRYDAVETALQADEFAALRRHEAPVADWAAVERVHAAPLIAAVKDAAPDEGLIHLDPDTAMGPSSLEAALRAAGAVTAAVDAVAAGEADNAFCAVRPPGHHAEPGRSMGFCVFNSAAIGAMHARAAHGLTRVAVVDFDVHHGNGTQAAFWDDADAFYGSTHQAPFYPGTGAREDRGAHGQIVNAPLAAGQDGKDFRAAMEGVVLPALEDFKPEFLIISAGFDAHGADPLGGLRFTEEDFAWATAALTALAAESCNGRVVSVLEGGYDLDALGASTAAHVAALMAAGEDGAA